VSGIDRRYSLFGVSSNLLWNESTRQSLSNSCFSKSLAIEVLSKAEPISHSTSGRKFLNKATKQTRRLMVFSSSNNEQAVLFYVPVTQTWLFQLNKSVNPHLPLFLPRGGGITGCL